MNQKLIALIVFVSFSCQQKPENDDVRQLRESLPQIELPMRFNSDIRVKYKTVELPNNGLIKKINERSIFSLLGKVFETESNITILGYAFNKIGTPILITFDRDGNEISTHALFETAASEPGHHTTNIATVLPAKQILFFESTVFRKLNKNGKEEISGSDSVLLTSKIYLILANGIIKAIK